MDSFNYKFTYKIIDELPAPPLNFIELAMELGIQKENQGNGALRVLSDWKGMSYQSPKIVRGEFNDEYTQWVKDNIVGSFKDTGIAEFPGTPNTPSTGAHTDGSREFALIFNINTGGPDAEVCFWREHGQDIIRPRSTQGLSTKKLDLIDSVKGPEGVWYMLNTRILHSLENIIHTRMNFQISFEKSIPIELKKYF